MKTILLVLLIWAPVALAMPPAGGGPMAAGNDGGEREMFDRALERARINAEKLRALQGPQAEIAAPAPLLRWPARRAISVGAAGVAGISNYVDQDDSSPDIKDFNCGDRTYDGHNGTDIFLTPFPWYQMEHDEGIVVAAAAGTIVEKVEDQPERSCTADTSDGDNNLIVIELSNGALALYAHMRTNSLTHKDVGESVSVGEYLGVIGSAGISTGPHLHFETGYWEQDNGSQVWMPQDPWEGTCNSLNDTTWWADQEPYYVSTLLDVATHDAAPQWPACPTTEKPHYKDSFSAGDTMYLSAAYRDQLAGQESTLTVRMPNGGTYATWKHSSSEPHYAGSFWYWSIDLPANAMSGKWKWIVEFQGKTLIHEFWVDASPPAVDPPPESNNAYNGLYYDPDLDGEGYNFVTAGPGTVIYFYGSDSEGKRFWLISELVSEAFQDGHQYIIKMYESTGGTHDRPIPSSRGLSEWGVLRLTFTDCNGGTAVLDGVDGIKTSHIVKLAAVPGTLCGDALTAEAVASGLWYATALEGEGYNLIVTPFGAVIYYYGFDAHGNRLWMIGGPLGSPLEIGQEVTGDLLKATSGTFAAPAPSNQLVKWGTVKVKLVSCTEMDYTLDTNEGHKFSDTVRLVNVTGLACD